MSSSEEFFCVEAVRHAKTLPFPQMMEFLKGMNFAVGDSDDFRDLRSIYARLKVSEDQLELIASGQLKLSLDSERVTKRRGK